MTGGFGMYGGGGRDQRARRLRRSDRRRLETNHYSAEVVEDLTTRCASALLATLQHLKIQAQQ